MSNFIAYLDKADLIHKEMTSCTYVFIFAPLILTQYKMYTDYKIIYYKKSSTTSIKSPTNCCTQRIIGNL